MIFITRNIKLDIMKLFKFFALPVILTFVATSVIYGQGDFTDFGEVSTWLISIATIILGELGKIVPKWKDLPLPRAVIVFLQGLAVAAIFFVNGWGTVVNNLTQILIGMGVFDLLRLLGKKKEEAPTS